MKMNKNQFIKDYIKAFGENVPMPIAFWHSDEPVITPEAVNGCFFPAFEKMRTYGAVSFDANTMKCGGGKFYCGLAPMPQYVPTFVSEKEHYKATPEQVEAAVDRMNVKVSSHKYLNFQRLDQLDDRVDYYGVLIFATPDLLSGLVSWAYYDNDTDDAVCTQWGSGCSATIRAVIRENERGGKRCFIGLFDPSVRPRVRENELIFAISRHRLEEMVGFVRDTCLFNGIAWPKVRERLDKEYERLD